MFVKIRLEANLIKEEVCLYKKTWKQLKHQNIRNGQMVLG